MVSESLESYRNRCIDCGACMLVQQQENMPAHTVHTLAQAVLAAENPAALDPSILTQTLSCSRCSACTVDCPVGLDFASVVAAARARLASEGPMLPQAYRPFAVDEPHNVFANLREVIPNPLPEHLSGDGSGAALPALFMPGCTLLTYAPELTAAVYSYLQEHNLATGITRRCCGNPLVNSGEPGRAAACAESLVTAAQAQGVQRIIVACPNCYRYLQNTLERRAVQGIELCPLPEVLLAAGMHFEPGPAAPYQSFCVHDSCPDRQALRFGSAVRALLAPAATVEMQHHGRHTICCGAGGLAGVFSDARPEACRTRRLEEFAATGASCMVTTCVACSNAFAQAPTAQPVRHYLELLFNQRIDWQRLEAAQITLYNRENK
jgi:Fe-S oxidoreductase